MSLWENPYEDVLHLILVGKISFFDKALEQLDVCCGNL